MRRNPPSVALALAFLGTTCASLAAQGPPSGLGLPDRPFERIQASDRAAGDLFACALSLSDGTLLVGSLFDDDRGTDSGSAYVFDLGPEGWSESAKLLGADTAAGDRFGFSVDLVGERALVGAPLSGPGGAAYRFERRDGVWRQTARWAFAEPGADAGSAVAWTAGAAPAWALVGVPLADSPSGSGAQVDSGAVLAFRADGPGGQAPVRLQAPQAQAGAGLGWAVAGTGELIAAGAPWADAPLLDQGSVRLFAAGPNGFQAVGEVTAPDAIPFQAFGYAVDLVADLLVVGAPRDGERGPSAGAIYVFRVRNGQALLEAKIPGATPGDQFGISVAVAPDGQGFAVGAHGGGGSAGPGVGYVDLFERQGGLWVSERRIQPAAASAGDGVGIDVALSAGAPDGGFDGLAIGAYKDDGGGADAGAAYVLTPAADLALVKRLESPASGERPPAPGEEVVFVVEVENRGPDHAFGARVLDAPPDGLAGVVWTCESEDGARCTSEGEGAIDDRVDLPVGAGLVYRMSGVVLQGQTGELVNEASVERPSGLLDPESDNGADEVAVTVGPPRSDLALAIRLLSGTAVPGRVVVHEVEIRNLGPSDAPTLRLLRNGLSPLLLDPEWTRCTTDGDAVCLLTPEDQEAVGRFTLPAGTRVVFRLEAMVDPGARGILIVAGNLGALAELDPNPHNNRARSETPLQPQGDLAVSLTPVAASSVPPPPPPLAISVEESRAGGARMPRQDGGAPTLHPGETTAYTVRVTNRGPSDTFGALVRVSLSPGLVAVDWTCTPEEGSEGLCGSPFGEGILADTPRLPLGSAVVYSFVVSASPGFLGHRPVAVSVTPETAFEDPDPSNNRAETAGPVLLPAPPGASFVVTLEALGPFVEGGLMTYEVLVARQPTATADIIVGVDIPPVLEVVAAAADTVEQPTLAESEGTPFVLWEGTVPADDVVTIRITARIAAGTRGQSVSTQALFISQGAPDPQLSSPPGVVREPGDEPTPTVFVVQGPLDIPTVSPWGLALLVLLLMVGALSLLQQRRTA